MWGLEISKMLKTWIGIELGSAEKLIYVKWLKWL
jgi:hypothetical protein